MSGPSARVFVARLAGTAFFDPNGDAVGKVRDVVVAVRHRATAGPRTRRRGAPRRGIFLAITRVTSIDAGQVITTGLVNMRRFQRQPYGTLALAELLDRTARVRATGEELVVYDLGLDLRRSRDWVLTKVAVQRRSKRFSRRGETRIYDWAEVSGLTSPEGEQAPQPGRRARPDACGRP